MRYVPEWIRWAYEHSPVQTRSIASTGYGILKRRREETGAFFRYLRALEESQWWDHGRLRELQCDRLKRLVVHAATVPYYRKLFAEGGISAKQIQTPEDLRMIPVLKKETVRTHFKDLLAPRYEERRLRTEMTSGTTGTPLTIWMDDETYLQARAAQWLHHRWAGYHHREWIGILAGYRVVPSTRTSPPFWVTNWAGKQIHFSAQHLRQSTMPSFVQKIADSRIEFLLGYPSAIGLLARHMVINRLTVPLRGVFLGSEPVFRWQVDAIQRAFLCPSFNYYAQAERVLSAVTCERAENLHINMELGIAEYVDHQNNKALAQIVGTSLTNYAMPLLRYELGDVSVRVLGACPCGRQHELIRPPETHWDSYLVTGDGSLVSPSLLYTSLQGIRGIISSQIVQETVDSIIVLVVANEAFTEDMAEILKRRIRECVGGQAEVAIRQVREIPPTSSGKFRFVISHVANDVESESDLN